MTEKKSQVQNNKSVRNEKFLAMYKEICDSEEFNNLKKHKRVKYLSEQFKERENIIIPIGTIYKLLRNDINSWEISIPSADSNPPNDSTENTSQEIESEKSE